MLKRFRSLRDKKKRRSLQSRTAARRQLGVESLEDRRLLAIATSFAAGVLTFTSDGDGDTLILASTGTAGEVDFDDGGGLGGATQAGVNSIVFNGNGGDDQITLNNSAGVLLPAAGTTMNVTFNGGSGDDVMVVGGSTGLDGSYTGANLVYNDGVNTQAISLNSVELIDDSNGANTFDVDLNGSTNEINVVDGPLLSPVSAFVQGPIVVDGGDRDQHGGFNGSVNTAGWQYIEQLIEFVHDSKEAEFGDAPSTDILAIGASFSSARAAIDSAASQLGLTVTHITGAGAVSAVDFNDHDLIYIPSNRVNTPGGITGVDLDVLVARRADIQAFIRAGGGLVALTDADTDHPAVGGNPLREPFGYLEIPDPFSIQDFGAGGISDQLRKTPEAIAAGLTISDAELTAGIPYHNTFTGPLPGFNSLDPFVLDRGPNSTVDGPFFGSGDDRVVTLGQGAINDVFGGGQALQVNDNGTNSFATINLANKVDIDVDSDGGNDQIIVNVTIPADGTATIDVDAGDGSDEVLVFSTPAINTVTIDGGADDDSIVVGNGTLDGILGPISILGSSGSDRLIVNDSADGESNSYRITGDSVDRNAGGPLLPFSGIETLEVFAGDGNDDLDINIDEDMGADQPTSLFVHGGMGDDVFLDSSSADGKITPSLISVQTLVGGDEAAADTVNLDMRNTDPVVIVDTVAGIAASGSHQSIFFTEFEEICLHDDAGLDRPIEIGHFYLRGGGDAERIIVNRWSDTGLRIQIDNLDTGVRTTRPEHFGLVGTQQRIEQITIYADGGNDIVMIGGRVNDFTGAPIPADIRGEGGNDYLRTGNANDLLVGGPGNDRLLGGNGDNVLFGDDMDGELPSDGNDSLSGGTGTDVLIGGGGRDRLSGISGDDLLDGGSGDDYADGGTGNDLILGGEGNDTLSGHSGDDVLLGGNGNDRVYGRSGNDLLVGGAGRDTLFGSSGDDTIVAGTSPLDTTRLDTDATLDSFTPDAALLALLADWTGAGDASAVTGGNTAGDGDRDDIAGDTGNDEFWVTLAEDLLRDGARDPGDVINDI